MRNSAPARPMTGPETDGLAVRCVVFTWAAVTLVCVPFWLGLVPADAVGAVIPVAQWIPAAVLLVLLARRSGCGRARIADLLVVRTSRRALAGHVVLALAAVSAVVGLHLVVASALGRVTWAAPSTWLPLLPLVPVVALTATLAATGEELTWRGGLHSLLRRRGFWATASLVSVAWGVFHLPLFAVYLVAGAMEPREVAVSLVNLLAASFLLSALRERTGSVWPAALGHGLLNSLVVFAYATLAPPSASHDLAVWSMAAVGWVLWLLAARVVVGRS